LATKVDQEFNCDFHYQRYSKWPFDFMVT